MTRSTIPVAVRQAREAAGWSQAELADRAGVSRPTIVRFGAGQDISVRTLSAVVRALGLELRVQSAEQSL